MCPTEYGYNFSNETELSKPNISLQSVLFFVAITHRNKQFAYKFSKEASMFVQREFSTWNTIIIQTATKDLYLRLVLLHFN